MKCVLLISILIFLHNATARLDNRNLLQTYEDVAEDPIISESCQEALQLYLENLESTTDMWALRMFDASSKIPVGILSLNFGELGQFSQCLGTESKDGFTQGKYCLSSLPLDSLMGTDVDDETADLEKRAQRLRMLSRNLVTLEGTSGDSSGPLEFAMTWAICLPSNCSDEDIREITNQITDSVSVSVRCQTKDDLSPSFTGGAIAAITALCNHPSIFRVLKWRKAFPSQQKLYRTNMFKWNQVSQYNMGVNRTCLYYVPGSSSCEFYRYFRVTLRSLTITNGTLSVDTFFFLSGLLVVYSFIKAMNNGVKFNIFKFYLHRYLRLTPALAAAVLFTAHLLRYVGESPRWDSISYLEKGCQRYWWTALLYVQNYVNDGIYCLDHTWYLSIDMQLYILSPLILLPLWKYPKIGMSLIGAGILAFIIVPFTIAYIYELPGLALSDIMDMNATRDYMTLYYMKTHTRAAPWFIGLLAGYILARIKFHGDLKLRNLNKILVCILWMVCIAVILTCIYGGHSTLRDPEHDVLANSFYIGFVRPVWAICLLWVVFACANGYGGTIESLIISPRQRELTMLAEELKMETLRITTFNNGELSGYRKKSNELIGTGVAFDIIHILQDKYNFNYTIVAPEDNVFLSPTKKLGAKDLLINGRADLIAAFLPIINSFHEEISYSRRFDNAEWVVLMKRPSESATGSGLLAPFTTPVWILIILSLLVVGPIIYLLILIQARLTRDDNNRVYPLPACVWFVYGALLKQGTTINPTTDSSRLLFSTWWIFITILTAFYTANLTAFLTLSKFTLPINEPSDIKQRRYQWVSNRANGIKDYIKEENKEMLPRGAKLADIIGNGTTFPETDDMSILTHYVTDRDMMFIREKSVLDNIMYRDYKEKTKKGIDEVKRCTYVVAKFPITKFPRAFAFRNNFKYRKLFDSAIQHLVESGIIEHKFVENLPDTEICPLNLGNTERQLRNADLLLTYLIVAGGLTVAIVVFILELLIRRYWKKPRRSFRGLLGNNKHVPTPPFENNNNYNNFDYIKKITPPPPSYNSLFQPPFTYRNCQKKNINGRDYWIVKDGRGGRELIPHRTPSALLFQWSR